MIDQPICGLKEQDANITGTYTRSYGPREIPEVKLRVRLRHTDQEGFASPYSLTEIEAVNEAIMLLQTAQAKWQGWEGKDLLELARAESPKLKDPASPTHRLMVRLLTKLSRLEQAQELCEARQREATT